jgi:hypothetical protein
MQTHAAAGFWYRLQVSDQIEIVSGSSGFGKSVGEIPPTKPHAGSSGQSTLEKA